MTGNTATWSARRQMARGFLTPRFPTASLGSKRALNASRERALQRLLGKTLIFPTSAHTNFLSSYVNEDWPRGAKPGRMGMTLNKDQRIDYGTDEAWIAALAHELGNFTVVLSLGLANRYPQAIFLGSGTKTSGT